MDRPHAFGLGLLGTFPDSLQMQMVYDTIGYLLANGVLPSSITVLTPYKGQLVEMRRRYPQLNGIEMQTVDRFQGDENDIIILSLVRTKALTQFIKREDRMVVALSRARFAMYIFGNASLLEKVLPPHGNCSVFCAQSGAVAALVHCHGHYHSPQ